MEKHKAVIKSEKYKKLYEFGIEYWFDHNMRVHSYAKHIGHIDIWTGEIDNPPLEENERVYIKELNETITIAERVRDIAGGYIYYTKDLSETIEDDETIESLEKAKQQELEYQSKKALNEEEPIVKKKWYQFWK